MEEKRTHWERRNRERKLIERHARHIGREYEREEIERKPNRQVKLPCMYKRKWFIPRYLPLLA